MKFQTMFTMLLVGVVSGQGDTNNKQTTRFPDQDDPILSAAGRNELFYNVSFESYDTAVTVAQDFVRKNKKNVIKNTVDLSIGQGSTNIVGFAYKLWAAGEEQIVQELFPPQFRMVFNDTFVKFTSNKYNMTLECSHSENTNGNKNIYGKELDGASNNNIWKLEPLVDRSSVYFKIRHVTEGSYLMMAAGKDRDDEHQAIGSPDSSTASHHWVFRPVGYNGQLAFRIMNVEYWQALKFGDDVYGGKRKVFSTGSDYYDHPEQNSWKIDIITDSGIY